MLNIKVHEHLVKGTLGGSVVAFIAATCFRTMGIGEIVFTLIASLIGSFALSAVAIAMSGNHPCRIARSSQQSGDPSVIPYMSRTEFERLGRCSVNTLRGRHMSADVSYELRFALDRLTPEQRGYVRARRWTFPLNQAQMQRLDALFPAMPKAA